jgi:predicted TIM-barrel fold metal-dependent hydrolase
MQGKIVLEEHFGVTDPDTIGQAAAGFPGDIADEHNARLLDIHERRLAQMDEHGIEIAALSLQAPAVQALTDVGQAIDWARRTNDYAAEQVARRSDRFVAFAALPLQDPDAAAEELTRCVKELGLKGALVNGFSQRSDGKSGSYYDEQPYRDFWATVEQLDVPFYLHPRDPLGGQTAIYDGHPWLLGSAWAFGVETATHALRLMASGLFDAHPRLQVILGHLGEMLPFAAWRIDHRFAVSPRSVPARESVSHYLQHNFHVTTSGNFRTPALMATIAELGADRVLFSVDYPFEDMAEGVAWFDGIEIGESVRAQIGRENARRLLKL